MDRVKWYALTGNRRHSKRIFWVEYCSGLTGETAPDCRRSFVPTSSLTSQARTPIVLYRFFSGSLLRFKTADIFALIGLSMIAYAMVTISKSATRFVKEYAYLIPRHIAVTSIQARLVI